MSIKFPLMFQGKFSILHNFTFLKQLDKSKGNLYDYQYICR